MSKQRTEKGIQKKQQATIQQTSQVAKQSENQPKKYPPILVLVCILFLRLLLPIVRVDWCVQLSQLVKTNFLEMHHTHTNTHTHKLREGLKKL